MFKVKRVDKEQQGGGIIYSDKLTELTQILGQFKQLFRWRFYEKKNKKNYEDFDSFFCIMFIFII